MATYTREQLRTFNTNSADFSTTAYTFTLNSNVSTTAGFTIEGINKDIFNSASISNTVSCTFVSSSTNAAFLIDPNTTARFDFTPTSVLGKDLVKFSAPNVLSYNINDLTASGSVFGVDLDLTGGCTSPTWTGDICLSGFNTKIPPLPETRTFQYDAVNTYNGQPQYVEGGNGAASGARIRWTGTQWEYTNTSVTGAPTSTSGPSDLCSPAGVYEGNLSITPFNLNASPVTVTEGTCPP